jgi:hypothetical protein
MAQEKRTRRPIILVVNYIIYSIAAGWISCWWFVSRYGGKMPPPGSLDDFLTDTWLGLTTGFLAPILATFLTSYIMSKRRRSGER